MHAMSVAHAVSLPPTVGHRTAPSDLPTRIPVNPRRSQPVHRSVRTLLFPFQLFLAAGWARAAVEKLIDPTWWNGDQLQRFVDDQRPLMLPWFRVFADDVVSPLAPAVAWLVLVTQVAIAGCLIVNRNVKQALWAGIVLNVVFTMAGRVNPSAFYLVMQLALLFALSRPVSTQIALRRAALWSIPALAVLPFARTVHPAHVIDDPALMLSFIAALAAITTVVLADDVDHLVEVTRSSWRRTRSRFSATRFGDGDGA